MAYIGQRGNRWRAETYFAGRRKSATFDTAEEAQAWVSSSESSAKRKREMLRAMDERKVLQFLPKRVVDAIMHADLTKQEIIDSAMPISKTCGIYFLVKDAEIVYVGKSTDVLNRISRHRRDRRDFDAFSFVACERERLDELERQYIEAFVPIWNCSLGAPIKVA